MRLSFVFILVLAIASVSASAAYPAQQAPTGPTASAAQTGAAAPTGAIYRWVDEQGQVHYSDRPLADAQEVVVDPVVTEFARPAVTADSAPLNDADNTANSVGNSAAAERTATIIQAPAVNVSFIEPKDEQSIRANDGNLRVRWQAQAERLNSGLLFLLRHNDRVVYQGEAPVFNFENLDRGAHTLQVQAVVNDNGRAGDLLAESDVITIYILRASILNPNNPLNRTNLVQK